MNNLAGAARPAFKRKILWIAVAAIVLALAWARAGFPDPLDPDFWTMDGPTLTGPKGMMPPDGARLFIVQNDPTGTYRYEQRRQRDGSYLITVNGRRWVRLDYDQASGQYELRDPNGTGAPVVKLVGSKAGVRRVFPILKR